MSVQKRLGRELRPVLVFLNGDLFAAPIPLERQQIILGRSLEADIRINDPKASRLHASITLEQNTETGETTYIIKDLNSRNGTFLNGHRIEKEILQNGDKITIGKHILKFELLDEIDQEYQKQIRRLLSHDELTGLLSSRSFFSELRREIARSSAEKRPVCVLMIDIDHFKKVNDTYGHLTGSKTLEEIGVCISSVLRSGDVAARFGGEEFAAFLLDANLAQGIIAAERIRKTIEETNFSVIRHGKKSDSFHRITVSIGVACFPTDSTDPIELVEMADSALYRAKREGRNRVCTYREITEEELRQPLPPRRDMTESFLQDKTEETD
ncbi:MAG: GGDEF domain-containing protein [Pyrinomonadaceae bacterium]|nr:GGDEF domain-containing protein [Pyrinomonadaceae bacterium]MCX7640272.1 GGDEF domain-containing protein [Pyrinomonadaceae bacterium]MDW8305280.1 GGDEF domain-containing protein [Acidobacteriota bacterium]